MLEIVTSILREGPICDDCLGRQFAKCSTNLTNKQRGQSIRIVKAMLENTPVNVQEWEAASGTCWVCGGLFSNLDFWVERCLEQLKHYEFISFLVGSKLTGRLAENEEILWAESKTTTAEPLKSALNRELGKRIELLTGKQAEFSRPDILLIVDLARDRVEIHANPLFLYGRYLKFVRGLPQTKWPCRECGGRGCARCNLTGKMYPESVQELMEPHVLTASRGEGVIFHGAGREDIDARMLGNGRPFVLEVKSPHKRKIDLQELEQAINSSQKKIAVTHLTLVDRETVVKVKKSLLDKVYRLKVIYEHPIREEEIKKALKRLEGDIEQTTPQRVVHRRADLTRRKRVYSAELRGNEILIRCEGGLYVKELISGDDDRTNPSLSSLLGVNAKVEELDVLEVGGGL
jgi:tRNA pseudouridine synthase 10